MIPLFFRLRREAGDKDQGRGWFGHEISWSLIRLCNLWRGLWGTIPQKAKAKVGAGHTLTALFSFCASAIREVFISPLNDAHCRFSFARLDKFLSLLSCSYKLTVSLEYLNLENGNVIPFLHSPFLL
jgi:hypothetical protein